MTQEPQRVGLVLTRPSQVLGEEPFYHEFIEGLERVLTPAGVSLLVKVVTDRAAESATYESWAARELVGGVILVDLVPGDDRVAQVSRLGIPAVVLGDPSTADGLPTVWTDDAGFGRDAVRYLAGRGHTVIGHVTGTMTFAHTQLRRGGIEAEAADRGLTLITAEGDYSQESGWAATAAVLAARPGRPTAIVYDNDIMAVAGLAAIREHGVRVPADVGVVAWDDSAQCQLTVPALSAMSHDVGRIGELSGNAVLAAMRDPTAHTVYEAPKAQIVERDSTR
ncbi:LacI family DNA-binding transcriptional regulator [Actinoplanes utahensis]|uniref:ABC transporter substrate-binding protein n=1 Tax=Actinoplanes utahensis TaxID=1869 RepID=A0A0A6X676_ACTUT|nr:substrate-binding domain-containing protein [Actinoplanes utahensis]KHD75617.1 ABC transporter substrate-binding protein [Actinoplanes utahensis]GIF27142.1 LacI family transcriptional regulator [Actinoplanes utahensis]